MSNFTQIHILLNKRKSEDAKKCDWRHMQKNKNAKWLYYPNYLDLFDIDILYWFGFNWFGSKSTFVIIYRENHIWLWCNNEISKENKQVHVVHIDSGYSDAAHAHINNLIYYEGVLFQYKSIVLFAVWQAAESSSMYRSWSNSFSFLSYGYLFVSHNCHTLMRKKSSLWAQAAIFHYN